MNIAEFFTPPIIWFLIGLALLLLELAVPGLIVIFFGIGAWITALLLAIFDFGINLQLLVFLSSSVLLLLILRKYLKNKFFSQNKMIQDELEDEFIGRTGVALVNLKPNQKGKIEFKGTTWNALSDTEIAEGEAVQITGKDSILLKVTKA
ncbi:MAG: NfeD family protein [Bacteroidales bacterium]|nr:NfeD family protein [Bacteroidales bacterium]